MPNPKSPEGDKTMPAPSASLAASKAPVTFTEEILGAKTEDATKPQEAASSTQDNVLGAGDGNVGIGLEQQQTGLGGQSFLGFLQTQRIMLGILAGLAILFVFNLYYRRAS